MTIALRDEYLNAPYELVEFLGGDECGDRPEFFKGPCYPARFNTPPPKELYSDVEAIRRWIAENSIAPFAEKNDRVS